MSKHFARDITAQIEATLRDTFGVAQLDTALLETIRTLTPEARRDWLAAASDAEIDRLAVCMAVEAGDASNWPRYAAALRAKQSTARAALQAVPEFTPPAALLDAALETLLPTAADSRRRNALKRARQLLGTATPLALTGGAWLVPSAQAGGVPYLVRFADGRYVCDCRTGVEDKPCKHAVAPELLALAWDLAGDVFADEEEELFPAPSELGARLARARALVAA